MDNRAEPGQIVVKASVAKAVEHGFLECEVDETDRARIKKYLLSTQIKTLYRNRNKGEKNL